MRCLTAAVLFTSFSISVMAMADPSCPPDAFCEDVEAEGTPPPADVEAEEEGDEPEAEAEELPASEGDVDEPVAISLDSENTDWAPDGKPEHGPVIDGTPIVRAGTGIFLAAYTVPFIVGFAGAVMADSDPDMLPLAAMLIPVGGPVITGAAYEASPGVWGLLGATSGMQLIGLIVMAIGYAEDGDRASTATVQPTPSGVIVRF
jgi:hypothetical protein